MPNETIARQPSADRTLYTLQAGRGIAAMAVVVRHATQAIENEGFAIPYYLGVIGNFGYLGVDFFFVLSGFIIYYVNHNRVGQNSFASSYLRSRLVRIYVPYLPIGIAVALAYLTIGKNAAGANDWNWFSTLTLLPSLDRPALALAWTLQHEVIFYVVALLCFLSGRFIISSILLSLALFAYGLFNMTDVKAMGLVDLEFLFGIIAAWCFVNGKGPNNLVLIAVGIVFLGMYFWIDNRFYSVVFGLGLALLILPIVRLEHSGRIAIGPVLKLFGNASYAIYLIHYPLVNNLARRIDGVDSLFLWVILIAISAVAGISYHKLFEAPALRLIRPLISRSSQESRLQRQS
ncbi:MAG: acyltransferase [Sphingomonadaceae bacterium]